MWQWDRPAGDVERGHDPRYLAVNYWVCVVWATLIIKYLLLDTEGARQRDVVEIP